MGEVASWPALGHVSLLYASIAHEGLSERQDLWGQVGRQGLTALAPLWLFLEGEVHSFGLMDQKEPLCSQHTCSAPDIKLGLVVNLISG